MYPVINKYKTCLNYMFGGLLELWLIPPEVKRLVMKSVPSKGYNNE
jgi:hypothetical protein